MRIIGVKLLKPIMFCCSTKWRFLLTVIGVAAIAIVAYTLWPKPDAATTVALPSSPSNGASTTQTSAAALAEGLALVESAYNSFDARIADYTATFEKQERVDDVLLPQETIAIKVRQQPFSVYLKHQAPADKQGQEAIYVDGQNDGNLVAHDGNPLLGLMTLRLPPQGFLAMQGNRHDITSAGMKNLLGQLLKLSQEQEENLARCHIRWIAGETVDKRPVRCLEIRSEERLPGFPIAIARIYFDDGYQTPVRYEAFEWPEDGGDPILVEFYQYSNVQLNPGLSDLDFDPQNEAYNYN